MANSDLPTPKELRNLLRYEPESGKFYWRERRPDMFPDGYFGPEHSCAKWNTRWANREAGYIHPFGYRILKIGGVAYRAHRVAWAMTHGFWPDGEIDHINHDRDDNRIANLRDVTSAENCRNKPLGRANTSGVMGVSWHRSNKKWIAQIRVGQKKMHLGYFTEIEDAKAARRAAERKYGFHRNHGRN